MAITFDDLPAQRAQALAPQRVVEINHDLTRLLVSEAVPAIGFVNEQKLEIAGAIDSGQIELLELWLDAGLELSAGTLELIDGARRYAEGTGFRIPVSSPDDCADVEVVVQAKMS